MNYEDLKRYDGSLNLGKELMNENPFGSFLYEKGQNIVRWSCEKIRDLQKVQLVYPPAQVGSKEEKLEHSAWLDSVN